MSIQTELIGDNYQKLKSMTTALAIKCIDGIVLASDSQSSTGTTKLTVAKIHKIKSNLGLVGAGDFAQVIDLVNFLKKNQYSESSDRLLTELNSYLLQLHVEKNVPYLNSLNQVLEDRFPFTPEFLIGAKTENNFHIYHGGFDEIGKFKCKTCVISEKLEPFETVGSGGHYTSLILNQLNRIYDSMGNVLSELRYETNIGIACYVINEVKNFDLFSGGDTQIVVIDKNGYNQISIDRQADYYEKMIENLSDSLSKELSSNGNIKKILRKIYPITQMKQ